MYPKNSRIVKRGDPTPGLRSIARQIRAEHGTGGTFHFELRTWNTFVVRLGSLGRCFCGAGSHEKRVFRSVAWCGDSKSEMEFRQGFTNHNLVAQNGASLGLSIGGFIDTMRLE